MLPLGLLGLLTLVLLLAFTLRLSTRLIQRERSRMLTDVTAYSGGVQYARSMNLLAASEQASAISWIATFLTGGSSYGATQRILAIQRYFLKAGPWLVEASTVGLGAANGILAVPAWNKKVLLKAPLGSMFTPSFNVKARNILGLAADTVVGIGQAVGIEADRAEVEKDLADELAATERELGPDGIAKAKGSLGKLLPGMDPDKFTRVKGYHYTRKDGSRVDLPPEAAGPRMEKKGRDGKDGMKKVYKTYEGNLYVAATEGFNELAQTDIEESGPHYLTLLSAQAPGAGWDFNVTQVQVDGGSLDMGDLHGGGVCWRPRLVPVRLLPAMDPAWGQAADIGLLVAQRLGVKAEDLWMRRAQRALNFGREVLAVQH